MMYPKRTKSNKKLEKATQRRK